MCSVADRAAVAAVLSAHLLSRGTPAASAAARNSGLASWERENRIGASTDAATTTAAASGVDDDVTFAYELEEGGGRLVVSESCKALGGRVWDSCVLACKMFEHGAVFEDGGCLPAEPGAVVELGAGCGLLSMLLRRLGRATAAVATDLQAVVPHLAQTVQRNGEGARVSARVLRWGCAGDVGAAAVEAESRGGGRISLVVAVDVCVFPATAAALVETIASLLHRAGEREGSGEAEASAVRCFVASPTCREGWAPFLALAEGRRDLVVAQVPASLFHPRYVSDRIACVVISRRCG
eukprot:Rhum_TRINITY_DN2738_c0_g1::Rhum_TRINITY_DN2738_c0_g1_i1::g.8001::m.8001